MACRAPRVPTPVRATVVLADIFHTIQLRSRRLGGWSVWMANWLRIAQGELDRLAGFIRRRVGLEEAEDILQEAYLALYRRCSIGQVIADPLGWLYRTVRNKIVDTYRRRGRSRVRSESSMTDAEVAGLLEPAEADAADPTDRAERAEFRKALIEEIGNLSPEQREVFLATEVDGRTYRELSEKTGVNLNTLLARKRYAVGKLRKALSEFGSDARASVNCSKEV